MAITYIDINDTQKLAVADLMQKIESIDSELADLNTEKAVAQVGWEARDQELQAEKNKLRQEVRNVRKATVAKTL